MSPALAREVERLGGRVVAPRAPATVRTVLGPRSLPPALAAFAYGVDWPRGATFQARREASPRGVTWGAHELPEPYGHPGVALLGLGADATQFMYVARLDDAGDDPEVFRIDHEGVGGHPLGASSRGSLSGFLRELIGEQLQATTPDLAFGDERVAFALMKELGLERPATRADLERLEGATLDLPGVTTLAGIEACARLRRLVVTSYQLRDVAAVGALASLRELRLVGSPIDDLRPLAPLVGLERLSVGDKAADLAPLASMARLAWLQALARQPDLEAIGRLEGLVELQASTSASDLGPLARLVRLERLELDAQGEVDLAPLAGLERLTDLTVRARAFVDLAPLARLPRLARLALSFDAPPPGLDALPARLERLSLCSCKLERADLVAHLVELRELDLSWNRIADLTPLSRLAKLEVLHLATNQVADVSPLVGLPALKTAWLGRNPVAADRAALDRLGPGVARA